MLLFKYVLKTDFFGIQIVYEKKKQKYFKIKLTWLNVIDQNNDCNVIIPIDVLSIDIVLLLKKRYTIFKRQVTI